MATETKLRFATATDVFNAFPTLGQEMDARPADEAPLVFLNHLGAGQTPEDAITFAAYMLPRREAVWWTVQCVRSLAPPRSDPEDRAMKIAEVWVREPEEHRRRAALEIGLRGDRNSAAAWVALAAAWSGGPILVGDQPGPPNPPHLTAQASRTAILIALSRGAAAGRPAAIRMCIDGAIRLAG
jgi:hypothetical protein